MSGTFVAVVLCLPDDGAAYQYFTQSVAAIDAMSGPDLQFAILDQFAADGSNNFLDLFTEKGRARYPGLVRDDLPCVWVEDQEQAHFLVRLRDLGAGEIRDGMRALADFAGNAESAAVLQNAFERKVPRIPEQASRSAASGKPRDHDTDKKEASMPKTPWALLQAAIQAVPAVKYALGVAGVVAAAALVKPYFTSPVHALLGTVAIFAMMILLYVFSMLTKHAAGAGVRILGLLLAWGMTLLFLGSITLFASSVFFQKPKRYRELVDQFRPEQRVSVTIQAQVNGGKDVIAGAAVRVRGDSYSKDGITNAQGKIEFGSVPESEILAVGASARGFSNGQTTIHVSDRQDTYAVFLDRMAPPVEQTPPPVVPTNGRRRQPAPPTIDDLRGTWQIQVPSDINNARILNGTFQFSPQHDGEILVQANFRADDLDVTVSGSASMSGSQVHLRYLARNSAGGSWNGRGTLTLARGHLDGRFELKSGESVSMLLRK